MSPTSYQTAPSRVRFERQDSGYRSTTQAKFLKLIMTAEKTSKTPHKGLFTPSR
jgi:hypothetical protein